MIADDDRPDPEAASNDTYAWETGVPSRVTTPATTTPSWNSISVAVSVPAASTSSVVALVRVAPASDVS